MRNTTGLWTGWGAWIRGLALAAAVALATLIPATPTLAVDKVTLKDGNKVLEGEIVREVDGYIWFKYKVSGIEKTEMFRPDQLAKVEREAKATPVPEAAPAAAAAAVAATPATPAPSKPGVPKACIITLGDRTNGEMVGVYFTAHALREAIPTIEKELGTDGSGIVIFRIYSGGGLGLEIPKMWDVIRNDYMKHFRCVAWIESAISAAAMTAHCMEDIYFTPQGNYGACTGWYGDLVAVKGVGLEEYLVKMEKISRTAGHDPLIMRAMQIQQPLSATIDENGNVKFYPDATSGEILVNREHEILTLNAKTAEKIKFSKGTAETKEELVRLMGYPEVQWVGEEVKGVSWPVCKAERMQMEFRRKTKIDEDRTRDYFQRYQTALEVARQTQDREQRTKAVAKARAALEDIKSMIRNNPNFILMIFNTEDEAQYKKWVEEQEKILRDLMK